MSRNLKIEYMAWYSMISRCYDIEHEAYHNYGGRGIFVCDRWLGINGFDNFYQDMGPRPSKNLSLDRINNDGNYCPENCHWATKTQQARNRRTNRTIIIDNETKSVAEWAEISGIDQRTIRDRLDDEWDAKLAVFTPIRADAIVSLNEKFSRWTVINIEVERSKSGVARCKCKCDCGNESIITIFDLKSKKSTQCKSCATREINKNRKVIMLTARGETRSLMEWSRKLNVNNMTIRRRLQSGWNHEEALFGKFI